MTELDRDDIQGVVLHGYRMPLARYLFVRFDSAAAGRRWLAAMIDPVTTAAEWAVRPPWCANLALTHPGLVALDLPAEHLAGFPGAFRAGMAERARSNCLGDPDADLPGRWEPTPPFATRGVHALLMVWADRADELAGRLVELGRLAAEAGGVTTVGEQDLQAIDGDREHFGFRDGISQPAIAGDGSDDPDPIAAGEFLLGHPDELGLVRTLGRTRLGDNGTFAVYRKLRQDVGAFRAVLDAGGGERLAAKLMGRWPSGAPLTDADPAVDPGPPDEPARLNAFDHRADEIGYVCPRGAHIRRARPRDGDRVVRRRRLIRRGMPYGPPLPPGAPDDGVDRGLVGLFLNADIERQYEFVQRRWLNEASFDGLSNETDPIAGDAGRDFTWPRRPLPRRRTGLPRFVTVRGGEYFFVPGLAGLRSLSRGGAA
jgi:Dyp-type peroxidase family